MMMMICSFFLRVRMDSGSSLSFYCMENQVSRFFFPSMDLQALQHRELARRQSPIQAFIPQISSESLEIPLVSRMKHVYLVLPGQPKKCF